jgi:hypothetical protein
MTVTSKPLITSSYVPNVETTGYPAVPGTRVILDKYTAYNSDTVTRTLTVKLVAVGGSAGASNVNVVKALAAGETYTFPEIVGHVLEPGGFISEIASAASVIVRRCSGRELT